MKKRAAALLAFGMLLCCMSGCGIFSAQKFMPVQDAAGIENNAGGGKLKRLVTVVNDTRVDSIFGWLGGELLVSGTAGGDSENKLKGLFRYGYRDCKLEIIKACGEKDTLNVFPSPDGRKALISNGIFNRISGKMHYEASIYEQKSGKFNKIDERDIDECGWSPDSRYLVYYSAASNSFYVYDTVECKTKKVQLPTGYSSASVEKPAISEDGEAVYFICEVKKGSSNELCRVGLSNSKVVEPVVKGIRDYSLIDNGSSVMYLGGTGKYEDELHIFDMDSGSDRKISGNVTGFSVSAGMDRVACCRDGVIYISGISGNVIEEGSEIYTPEGLGSSRPCIRWGLNDSALLLMWGEGQDEAAGITHKFVIEIM